MPSSEKQCRGGLKAERGGEGTRRAGIWRPVLLSSIWLCRYTGGAKGSCNWQRGEPGGGTWKLSCLKFQLFSFAFVLTLPLPTPWSIGTFEQSDRSVRQHAQCRQWLYPMESTFIITLLIYIYLTLRKTKGIILCFPLGCRYAHGYTFHRTFFESVGSAIP